MIHAHRRRPNRRDRNPPGFPGSARGSMLLMSPDDLALPDRRAGEADQVHVSSIILDVPFEFSLFGMTLTLLGKTTSNNNAYLNR